MILRYSLSANSNCMASDQVKVQHLLWRAGFGPGIKTIHSSKVTPPKTLETLIAATAAKPDHIQVTNKQLIALYEKVQQDGRAQLTADDRRMLRRESAKALRNLNLAWLSEMIGNEDQLREKMSLFWHGHFSCRIVNLRYQQHLLDIIRRNALGNFGDLLREVSKSPAMLSFLNNQQNRKSHPNENFSRELLELFTMGRGNYTEQDVREGARAFTGWGFNAQGLFIHRKGQHDDGEKHFLGRKGRFDGDDALNIILEQKATARFLTRKLYAFFVNEQIDEQQVQELAERFYHSNYNIMDLMQSIFSSDWFYDEKNIGTRIKSPVELIAGIRRMLPVELGNPEIQLVMQKALGQILFYPPNVAGWPGGKSWIDSSALMLRLRLPQILTQEDSLTIRTKSDDDVMMGLEQLRTQKSYRATARVDWQAVTAAFSKVKREDLLQSITTRLLQTKRGPSAEVMGSFSDASSREAYIRSSVIKTMSTPEYQLC